MIVVLVMLFVFLYDPIHYAQGFLGMLFLSSAAATAATGSTASTTEAAASAEAAAPASAERGGATELAVVGAVGVLIEVAIVVVVVAHAEVAVAGTSAAASAVVAATSERSRTGMAATMVARSCHTASPGSVRTSPYVNNGVIP